MHKCQDKMAWMLQQCLVQCSSLNWKTHNLLLGFKKCKCKQRNCENSPHLLKPSRTIRSNSASQVGLGFTMWTSQVNIGLCWSDFASPSPEEPKHHFCKLLPIQAYIQVKQIWLAKITATSELFSISKGSPLITGTRNRIERKMFNRNKTLDYCTNFQKICHSEVYWRKNGPSP